jgi:hypothetical protein
MIMDAWFGAGTSNQLYSIAHPFTNAYSSSINVSTYRYLEADLKNGAGWDQYNQLSAVRLQLQVATNATWYQGTWPDLRFTATGEGSVWTHYAASLNNWAAYDLTRVTNFALRALDFNYVSAPTEVYLEAANLGFSGAPAWNSAFTVNNRNALSGSTSVQFVGKLSGTVGGAPMYAWVNTPVAVIVNNTTNIGTIYNATGDFSVTVNTTGWGNGSYPVSYEAGSDMVGLLGATNTSTSLTLTATPPTRQTINQPYVSGNNLVVYTPTQIGWNYALQTATNVVAPITWTTVSVTAGTGGNITNLVSFSKSSPPLYLRYQVQ